MKNVIIASLNSANVAYVARKGLNLNKDGMNPDIASAISTISALSDATIASFSKSCDISVAMQRISAASNIKKALRAIDVLTLLATDDLKYCRASAKVFIIEYAGLLTAGVKTRSGLQFVATGKGDENTSDSVSVQKAGKLRAALGATARNSVQTQESVSWSKGGLGEILQAIVPGTGARGKMPEIVIDAQIHVALDSWFKKLTDSKISLIAKQNGGK